MRQHKALLLLTILLNVVYLVWLAFHVNGTLGHAWYVVEIFISSLSFLFAFNHWGQDHVEHSDHSFTPSVDVFLTIVDEPLALFEPVLASAKDIAYANKKVYVLDDGARKEVRDLAAKYGATYLTRPDKPKDYKAGNLNHGFAHSDGAYLLVIDADQRITDPAILDDLMGHFKHDEKLAMVATRQRFDVPHLDFNHDTLFYEHMQTGKNEDNAAISSGSGVIYSRAALTSIGGFQTWNVVEDLYTAYVLHQCGYRTLYVNKPYTLGTAPMDLAAIYKQRGTWATDTLRLFFKKSPLLAKGLTFRQRIHYSELALVYLVSAFAIAAVFLLPIYTVAARITLVDAPVTYVLLRVPSLAAILWLYYRLSGNSFTTSQFWAALFPVYLKATLLALLPGKPKYKVTRKVGSGKRDTLLALPHLAMLGAAAYVSIQYLAEVGMDGFLAVHLVWFALMLFWFAPLIRKSLYKE
jgi:cellulose synthase (UDP-forming)